MMLGKIALHVIGLFRCSSIHLYNDIALLKPALIRRAVLNEVVNQNALGGMQAQISLNLWGDLLGGDTEPGARNVAIALEIRNEFLGFIDGDGKTDAAALAGFRKNHGVDPYDLALHIKKRTAAVAGVNGSVGLDEIIKRARADSAVFGADDSDRDGVAQAEGIADGKDGFADSCCVGVAERNRLQIVGSSCLDRGSEAGPGPFSRRCR